MLLPIVAPVAMPVVRLAIIGVRAGAIGRPVVTGTIGVIAVTGSIVRSIGCGRAGRDCAGGKAEGQARAYPARCAGAVIVVAPMVATAAMTASVFLIFSSSSH